ncbi:Metallo-dependent phosphatase-like protein [Dactylonectria macrodidyma]|uniref:Metallo-dependent phosphatase-like protein n=1 Tax=Dactylonectria macrodidyma TaxID=307937 RepID=A0A9P9EJV3_9HYPO|nr:Metallo-dependent phosphatase-like protein [Dactylonectria macrodidyma]
MDFLQRFSDLFMGPPTPNGKPCGRQVQIMSDLHLELNRQYADFDFAVKAPLLVLGGDIGRLIDYEAFLGFLARQTARFDRVFLVLGHHEFYEMSYDEGIAAARRLEREEVLEGKLVLLDRDRWDDEASQLTVLGCTLWSDVPAEAEADVAMRVSDYKMIAGWTVARHNECHDRDLSWLKATLTDLDTLEPRSEERLILVVTHHAPCSKGSSPKAVPFEATDVLERPQFARVAWWMFGHTHFSTRFQRGGIRLVANQRGYALGCHGPPLEDTRGFDAEKVVEL